MSAVVIPRFTMRCKTCGAMITSIASRKDAEWAARSHNENVHPDETKEIP